MTDHLSRRRRGRDSEVAVARYLAANGWPAAEAAPTSRTGEDVLGIPGLAIEVKARRGLDLPAWMRQASSRDGLPVLVIRGNGQGPTTVHQWTAALPLARMVELLHQAGYAGRTEKEEPPR